jgi:hypothetical protein
MAGFLRLHDRRNCCRFIPALTVRVVEPLIAALKDTDSRVRRAATESLSKVGYEAVAALATALKDTDSDVRGYGKRARGPLYRGTLRAPVPRGRQRASRGPAATRPSSDRGSI